MKIYTRTGDAGDTSLFDGTARQKDDARVDAYGEVDELNAWLGLARAVGARPDARRARSSAFSAISFALGAAARRSRRQDRARGVTKAALGDDDVARLEQLIDRLEAELPPLRRFILAGGSACRRRAARRARRSAGAPNAASSSLAAAGRSGAAALRQPAVRPAVRRRPRRQPPRRRRLRPRW